VPLTVLERVREGLAALGTRSASAPPAPSGVHVPAALLPSAFVPQGTAPGGMVRFGYGSDDHPLATREPSFSWFEETEALTS
jgi:hypothetical protein